MRAHPAALTAARDAIASMPNWPLSRELADATFPPGVEFAGTKIDALTVQPDGTIVYGPTGQVVDEDLLSWRCDPTAAG